MTTPDAKATAPAQPTCPACQSATTVTTSKNPDSASYWRCCSCGEIWNVERRQDNQRSRPRWW